MRLQPSPNPSAALLRWDCPSSESPGTVKWLQYCWWFGISSREMEWTCSLCLFSDEAWLHLGGYMKSELQDLVKWKSTSVTREILTSTKKLVCGVRCLAGDQLVRLSSRPLLTVSYTRTSQPSSCHWWHKMNAIVGFSKMAPHAVPLAKRWISSKRILTLVWFLKVCGLSRSRDLSATDFCVWGRLQRRMYPMNEPTRCWGT